MDKKFVVPILRQYGFQILSLVVLIANIWLGTQLAPLVNRIQGLEVRATNLENFGNENKPLIERFLSLEERVRNIDNRTTRIENKIDALR